MFPGPRLHSLKGRLRAFCLTFVCQTTVFFETTLNKTVIIGQTVLVGDVLIGKWEQLLLFEREREGVRTTSCHSGGLVKGHWIGTSIINI